MAATWRRYARLRPRRSPSRCSPAGCTTLSRPPSSPRAVRPWRYGCGRRPTRLAATAHGSRAEPVSQGRGLVSLTQWTAANSLPCHSILLMPAEQDLYRADVAHHQDGLPAVVPQQPVTGPVYPLCGVGEALPARRGLFGVAPPAGHGRGPPLLDFCQGEAVPVTEVGFTEIIIDDGVQ